MTDARNAPETPHAPETPGAPEAPEAARLSTLLLRQLADLVAGLDEQQIGELLAGRARLTVTAAPGRPARSTPTRATPTQQTPARQTPASKATPATRRRTTRPEAGSKAETGPKTGAAPPASVDVEALRAALLGAASREEAAERLAALGRVSVPQLRALAGALGVDGVGGKDPKATVIRKIVDGTVGFRLSSQAMLSEEADL
ncbi:hypothetical protein [Frankia sp. ACN1ag]|uniref:hypothetical protein n=1 Tax=Frankia sp. ACN1ag TaxID=102891 RepID=UPI0006DC63BD|nr:hypothetical protein [Frankia sp. ACN1ag]KQC38082.1 hypothetical protein UK82_12200 [Frankia sp. ACN1ag]